MTGAIIGDLAAWTYRHDQSRFETDMLSPDSRISEVGMAVVAMSEMMLEPEPDMEWRMIKRNIVDVFVRGADVCTNLPAVWRRFLFEECDVIPPQVKQVMLMATCIVGGWCNDPQRTAMVWGAHFHGGKEEHDLMQVTDIIWRLRHGATKKEAVKGTCCIADGPRTVKEGADFVDSLTYARLAWQCFEEAIDFTTAMENVMRCPYGNKHLLGVLTGALAEAMYGCKFRAVWREDRSERIIGVFFICLPKPVCKPFWETLRRIENIEEERRVFYPKNDSRTNLSDHTWTEVRNPWQDMTIDRCLKNRILLAFETDWDHRHGLYLEEGWIYCYRSMVLLCRFKLVELEDGTFRIRDLQKSEDTGRYSEALMAALRTVGVDVTDHDFPPALLYCKYYQGELETPKEMEEDPVKNKFWHGEMMFCKMGCNLDEWYERAEEVKKGLSGEAKAFADKLYYKQSAIVLFIEELYRKWCPMDDMGWIFEY